MKDDIVTCEEARGILQRFNDSHWDNPGRESARYSIPANPDRDDDIRLARFISQAEAWQTDLLMSKGETIDLIRLLAEERTRVRKLTAERDEAVQGPINWAVRHREERDRLTSQVAKLTAERDEARAIVRSYWKRTVPSMPVEEEMRIVASWYADAQTSDAEVKGGES